jgi:hypothetical protein
VFDMPEAATVEEEIARRRKLSKGVVAILIESEKLQGETRTAFVRDKMAALELEVNGRTAGAPANQAARAES